jgi:hypothetical protein
MIAPLNKFSVNRREHSNIPSTQVIHRIEGIFVQKLWYFERSVNGKREMGQ